MRAPAPSASGWGSRALGIATLAALLTRSEAALACSTCGSGDPTLSTLASGRAFAGRVRVGLEAKYREDKVGGLGRTYALSEGRVDAHLAWSPSAAYTLLASVPFLYRRIVSPSLRARSQTGLGDTEVRLRARLWSERNFAPSHTISIVAGLRTPTGILTEGAQQEVIPLELRPTSGALEPLLGASYSYAKSEITLLVSLVASAPTLRRKDLVPSASLRTVWAGQWQALAALGLRAGIETRFDSRVQELGKVASNSGGAIAYGAFDVLLAPLADLVVMLSARLPVVNALWGSHQESPIVGATVLYDF
jgi:hypothetical protein